MQDAFLARCAFEAPAVSCLAWPLHWPSTPWNLTGYTGTMTVRPFVGASTTTVVASTANGRMVFDAINGRVTVTLSSTITGDIDAGRYAYDLVLNSGSVVTRILEGKFIVTGAVTT